MNWPLVVAGSIVLVGATIHGLVGDRLVRGVDSERQRGAARFQIRVTWHLTTIAFVGFGVALVAVGLDPRSIASAGVTYVTGAVVSCWSVFVIVAAFRRGGLRGWRSHPAPLLLSVTAALIWWGAAAL